MAEHVKTDDERSAPRERQMTADLQHLDAPSAFRPGEPAYPGYARLALGARRAFRCATKVRPKRSALPSSA
jgi:hypothetical protein